MLHKEISQYIYKNRTDWSGKIVGKEKVGFLVAGKANLGPNGEEILLVGYSVCYCGDKYDVIKGRRVPGFGKDLARKRAIKFANSEKIEVPIKIKKKFQLFMERCRIYYKDCDREFHFEFTK